MCRYWILPPVSSLAVKATSESFQKYGGHNVHIVNSPSRIQITIPRLEMPIPSIRHAKGPFTGVLSSQMLLHIAKVNSPFLPQKILDYEVFQFPFSGQSYNAVFEGAMW